MGSDCKSRAPGGIGVIGLGVGSGERLSGQDEAG
jgi:hypothetical protein